MRLVEEGNPDENRRRKPDNWSENFEGDDFADFIKPIFDTLDLYHNQGVDPRAIAISWKQLAENHSDAKLQFASMEVKGENNLLLRLKTEPNADLSQLSAEYFDTYNQIKALTEEKYKQLTAEKDDRIQQLENMVNTALKRPSFYAENYNHQGDNKMSGDRYIKGNNNEKIEGNYYEQSGNFGIGQMSGGEIKDGAKVAGVINEAEQQNLADAAAKIQQLLTQLQSQGFSPEEAQQKAATDLATQAKEDPTALGKLVKWGQSLGDTAAQTTVSEAAKEVVKLALKFSGVLLP